MNATARAFYKRYLLSEKRDKKATVCVNRIKNAEMFVKVLDGNANKR